MNPLDLTSDLKKTYLRYLRTSFSLRDPELMKSFAEKLECFTFFRGPFLEATPPFETGIFLKELVSEGLLDERFSVLLDTAMPIMARNRLYRHQEKAIRKILSGRNVVIASGTGSGKTESFLIPVLDDILKAYRAGTLAPGIRALILYPMNALVNDHLRRLRKIGNAMISDAGKPILTFGRYTGETPETQPQGLTLFRRQNLGVEPAAGELLSRDEMRAAPPHILITNYAMLEYLLIRPGDIPLFESSGGDGWKFLILDEAHVYTGAMGTEIALLMRRLRNRVGRGQRDSMRCVDERDPGDD
jgi:ATP-dependent helicase YprA (DUF1998 family)